jgi:hypothetical protein
VKESRRGVSSDDAICFRSSRMRPAMRSSAPASGGRRLALFRGREATLLIVDT